MTGSDEASYMDKHLTHLHTEGRLTQCGVLWRGYQADYQADYTENIRNQPIIGRSSATQISSEIESQTLKSSNIVQDASNW